MVALYYNKLIGDVNMIHLKKKLEKMDFDDFLENVFCVYVVVILIMFCCFMINLCNLGNYSLEPYQEKIYLDEFDYKNTQRLNSLDSTQYYIGYEELNDGGKKLIKFNVEYTTIYDNLEESEKSYAEIEKIGIDNPKTISVKVYVPKNGR